MSAGTMVSSPCQTTTSDAFVTVAPSSVYSVPHSVAPWLLMQNAVSPPPSRTPWSILSVSR